MQLFAGISCYNASSALHKIPTLWRPIFFTAFQWWLLPGLQLPFYRGLLGDVETVQYSAGGNIATLSYSIKPFSNVKSVNKTALQSNCSSNSRAHQPRQNHCSLERRLIQSPYLDLFASCQYFLWRGWEKAGSGSAAKSACNVTTTHCRSWLLKWPSSCVCAVLRPNTARDHTPACHCLQLEGKGYET